jgi:hypothetical protein
MDYYAVVQMDQETSWYKNFINFLTMYIDAYPRMTPLTMSFIISLFLLAIYLNTLVMCKRTIEEERDDHEEDSDEVIEKILDQVGDDKDSWPVMLVNEVILLKNMLNEMRANHA